MPDGIGEHSHPTGFSVCQKRWPLPSKTWHSRLSRSLLTLKNGDKTPSQSPIQHTLFPIAQSSLDFTPITAEALQVDRPGNLNQRFRGDPSDVDLSLQLTHCPA